MEWGEFVKIYGPMALGWVGFAYIGKIFLDRNKEDIESRVKLAVALEILTNLIKDNARGNHEHS